MKVICKKLTCFLLMALFLLPCVTAAGVEEGTALISQTGTPASNIAPFTVDAKSAVLMEVSTGQILFAQNADEALPPASVTKVMTLLLVMEAIDAGKITYSDTVTASEHATSMGGSQIFLKVGEQMSVEDLLKSVVVASANDAALALAEHIAGSEEAFVRQMNERAKQLGMRNTHFENTNGLDDTTQNHVTSARDIAIMSCELLKHKDILRFTTIWTDTIRNGEFGLTNTNRLVRFYPGATGLKTGSTSRAKFCISASAEREGMHLVAVIMASPTRDIRNAEAKKLLDYGFANYACYKDEGGSLGKLPTLGGTKDECAVSYPGFSVVLEKDKVKDVQKTIALQKNVPAPILRGEVVGEAVYTLDGKKIGSARVVTDESIGKITFGHLFVRMLEKFFLQ